VVNQRRMRDQPGQRLLQGRWEVGVDIHRHDAGQRLRLGGIDATHAGMRMGAPQQRGVKEIGRGDVVDEGPGSGEQAGILVAPGAFMTLATMRQMSERARQILSQAQVAGLVVTHGTDTLEESAYLLYLTVDTDKPVVFTGAMRNSSQIGFDGYRNLYDAIRVAANERARGLGTRVALNDEMHTARCVNKTNGPKEDTYETAATGPAGAAA